MGEGVLGERRLEGHKARIGCDEGGGYIRLRAVSGRGTLVILTDVRLTAERAGARSKGLSGQMLSWKLSLNLLHRN